MVRRSATASATKPPRRRRSGGPAPSAVFFAIPALIVALLFPFGEATLMRIQEQETPQVQIRVEGFQWEWTFLYLNEGIFVSGKTLVRPAVMVLPVDEPVADHADVPGRDPFLLRPRPPLQARRDPGPDEHVHLHADRARDVPVPMRRVLRALAFADDVPGEGRDVGRLPGVDRGTAEGGPGHHLRRRTGPTFPWSPTTSRGTRSAWPFRRTPTFTVDITNQDAGIEHNFSIYDSFFEKQTFFTSPKITGPATETLDVPGLPAGRYYFQCDVHGPAMSGAFIVG